MFKTKQVAPSFFFLLLSLFFAVHVLNISRDAGAVFFGDLSIMCQCTSQLPDPPPGRSGARTVQVTFIFATTGTEDRGAAGEKSEKFHINFQCCLEDVFFFFFRIII